MVTDALVDRGEGNYDMTTREMSARLAESELPGGDEGAAQIRLEAASAFNDSMEELAQEQAGDALPAMPEAADWIAEARRQARRGFELGLEDGLKGLENLNLAAIPKATKNVKSYSVAFRRGYLVGHATGMARLELDSLFAELAEGVDQ